MLKHFNQLVNEVIEMLSNILPLLIIAIFYQVTVLQIPRADMSDMLLWVLLVIVGLTLGL